MNKQVTQEFEFLDKYRGNDVYSSLFKNRLAFHFKKAYGKSKASKTTYLMLNLNKNENQLEIGIQSYEERDLRKLKRKLDLRELAKEIAKLDGFTFYYGWDFENVIEGTNISEIHRSISEANKLFGSRLTIQRAIAPDELEKKFGLNTSEFPRAILRELLKLKGILTMFNDAL
ncbi:MAG: hypothetical protein ACXAB0_10770 [Candidatus Thorarchaeota archaeon]|jgi:hypothetical protein